MKILQFIYSLVPGGAERFVVDLTNELSDNHNVVLYTLRDDTIANQGFYVSEISEKVTYKNLKIEPGFKFGLIWSFYKIIKSEKPDVVHCHLNLVNYFFMSSFLLRNRIRFIYTIHNAANTEVSSGFERLLRRFFYKHGFFIPVAISEETQISYQSFYKLQNTEVIINGRKFSNKSSQYKNVENEVSTLKKSDKTVTFCHLARYDEAQKNQTMLISVFNKLRDEGYDIILLIMGEGFEDAVDLRSMANDHIHFLGIKPNATDYLFATDGFCLSSNFEGMPISLIEALGCGCVPVCTPVGGIINTIEHGVTGFLSISVSESDYLEAVKQFISNRYKINKEKLMSVYNENFSIEQCAKQYVNLYNKL